MIMKLSKFFPLIFFITFTIILFRNTLIPSSNQILNSGDLKHIYYPYREFLRDSIISGQLPLWNPYLFSGTPFIAHPYTEFFYPTTLPLIFLPTNIYYSLLLALHILIAGLSMYYLLKKFTDNYAAILGGSVFAFSGYFSSRIYAGHIDYVISTALFPFIFQKIYEYIVENNKKSLFWGSLVLAFQVFTGLLIMTVYFGFVIGLFFLCFYIKKKSLLVRSIGKIFIFSISGFGLSAVYLLPCYEFISNTVRGIGLSYRLSSYGSAAYQTLVMFLFPNFYGSDFTPNNPFHGLPPDYSGHVFYVGLTSLTLILAGLIYHLFRFLRGNKFHPQAKIFFIFSAITLIFIIISFGPNSPVNLHLVLWKLFSVYKTTRLPVRHLIVTVFTLSILTGLSAYLIKNKVIKIILIIIIFLELIPFGRQFISLTDIFDLIPANNAIISSIIQDKNIVRILSDYTLNSPVREEISFASPLIYKYFSPSGYTPAILSNYYEYIDRINGNVSSSIYLYSSEIVPTDPRLPGVAFLNAKYIIVDNSADFLKNNKDYKLLNETALYRIYKSWKFLPRFFFAPMAKIYSSRKELAENLYKDQNEFDHQVSLLSSDSKSIKYTPDCSGNENPSKIEVINYDLNSVVLKSTTSCNGFVSTSETNFPGWKAKIDNNAVKIMTSNLSFRAINIPSGTHTVTMEYQPTVYYIGGIISLATLGGLIIFVKRNKSLSFR